MSIVFLCLLCFLPVEVEVVMEENPQRDWSINGVINNLYEAISFLPGDEPDWETFQQLFSPKAIFVSSASTTDESAEVFDLQRFIEHSKSGLASSGMQRKGTNCESQEFMKRVVGS